MPTSRLTIQLPLPCSMRIASDYKASCETAIKENPANATLSQEAGTADESELQPRLLVSFTKYWARGRTLRIEFLQNPPEIITQPIIKAAKKWLPYVNLKFEFVTSGPSDIRIGLNEQLNWSELGTDALLTPADKATMEFNIHELFAPGIKPLPELERIVLHEFGHALGAVHEHQHPDAKIPWNQPVLIALLKAAGYSEALIHENFLNTYDAADFNHTPYDRDSIMHLDIPGLLTHGDFEVINIGKTLSRNDIEMMRKMYPDRSSSKFETP